MMSMQKFRGVHFALAFELYFTQQKRAFARGDH